MGQKKSKNKHEFHWTRCSWKRPMMYSTDLTYKPIISLWLTKENDDIYWRREDYKQYLIRTWERFSSIFTGYFLLNWSRRIQLNSQIVHESFTSFMMFIKVVGTSPRDPINNLPSNESSIAGSFSFIFFYFFLGRAN